MGTVLQMNGNVASAKEVLITSGRCTKPRKEWRKLKGWAFIDAGTCYRDSILKAIPKTASVMLWATGDPSVDRALYHALLLLASRGLQNVSMRNGCEVDHARCLLVMKVGA